jgi:hypothetical protein
MSDENDRDLQRLFAAYAPVLPEEPFLTQTGLALIRQIRLARLRSAISYALLGIIGVAVAAATAAPLNAFGIVIEKAVNSASFDLPPVASQAVVYATTAAVLVLGRRRIRAFLGPW